MVRLWVTLVGAALLFGGCATVTTQSPPNVVSFDPRADQVTISASIGKTPLRLLVDTAVDPSALDRETASRLQLAGSGPESAIEGVGSDNATASASTIPRLAIHGRTYGPIEVLVFDMTKLQARFGAKLDGILGYSFLKGHAVLIDYPANRIAIYDGPAKREPVGCATVHRFPLRFLSKEDKLILVPGLKIGGVEVPAMLDTGSSNALRIDVDAPPIAPIRPMLPEGEAGTSVGARGEAAHLRGRLTAQITLGAFRLDSSDVTMISGRNAQIPANIGNRFLRALGARLLVDMPGQRVGLYGNCR